MTPDNPQQIQIPGLPKFSGIPPMFMMGQQKPKQKSAQASFLNSTTSLPSRENLGNKQLIGQ